MAELNLAEGLDALNSRTRMVQIALLALVGISIAEIAVMMAEIGGKIDPYAPVTPFDWLGSAITLAYLFVTIAAMIIVAMWIYRAHANLHAAGMAPLQFTPGWAVGWYFVPFATLYKPFQAMRELWNCSLGQFDSYGQEADSRLRLWWGTWIIGNILGSLSVRFEGAPQTSAAITGSILASASTASLIAACWFLWQIVDTINAAQRNGTTLAQAFA